MDSILVKNWNMIDSLIYKTEGFISAARIKWADQKMEEPDPEEMIEAATAQLRRENAELKKFQYPAHLVSIGDKYYCPHCKIQISKQLIEQYRIKCCIECGKRLIL